MRYVKFGERCEVREREIGAIDSVVGVFDSSIVNFCCCIRLGTVDYVGFCFSMFLIAIITDICRLIAAVIAGSTE